MQFVVGFNGRLQGGKAVCELHVGRGRLVGGREENTGVKSQPAAEPAPRVSHGPSEENVRAENKSSNRAQRVLMMLWHLVPQSVLFH